MPTSIGTSNIKKLAPRWWRRLERSLLIAILPAATMMIQSWPHTPEQENTMLRLNLFIGTGLVALIKGIGMTLADTDDDAYLQLKDFNKKPDEPTNPS